MKKAFRQIDKEDRQYQREFKKKLKRKKQRDNFLSLCKFIEFILLVHSLSLILIRVIPQINYHQKNPI